jgi:hypothetical protein
MLPMQEVHARTRGATLPKLLRTITWHWKRIKRDQLHLVEVEKSNSGIWGTSWMALEPYKLTWEHLLTKDLPKRERTLMQCSQVLATFHSQAQVDQMFSTKSTAMSHQDSLGIKSNNQRTACFTISRRARATIIQAFITITSINHC